MWLVGYPRPWLRRSQHGPTVCVDVAILTIACVVRYDEAIAIARSTGDSVWQAAATEGSILVQVYQAWQHGVVSEGDPSLGGAWQNERTAGLNHYRSPLRTAYPSTLHERT